MEIISKGAGGGEYELFSQGEYNCITWFQDPESPLNLHEDFQSIQYILVRGQK